MGLVTWSKVCYQISVSNTLCIIQLAAKIVGFRPKPQAYQALSPSPIRRHMNPLHQLKYQMGNAGGYKAVCTEIARARETCR